MGLNYKKVKFSHQVAMPMLLEEREKMKVNKLEISRLDQGYLVIVTYYNGALDKGRYAFNTLAGMLDFVLPLLNKCDEKY